MVEEVGEGAALVGVKQRFGHGESLRVEPDAQLVPGQGVDAGVERGGVGGGIGRHLRNQTSPGDPA